MQMEQDEGARWTYGEQRVADDQVQAYKDDTIFDYKSNKIMLNNHESLDFDFVAQVDRSIETSLLAPDPVATPMMLNMMAKSLSKEQIGGGPPAPSGAQQLQQLSALRMGFEAKIKEVEFLEEQLELSKDRE
ncbi:unnamed protein product, partial [Amoebophrya sp. A120]|eukprot:GSA120T00022760001.1